MRNRDVLFVVVAVLVMSCLTIAGSDNRDRPDDLYGQYRTFTRLVHTVTSRYVEEVESEKLFYGAYQGMLQSLDPHSAFLPPEQKTELEVETKGEFGGLGIEITIEHGVLTVITPLEDTPAFRAGVLAGDRIVRIEEQSTKGISIYEAVKKLRGPKGEPVTITVLHPDGTVEDIRIVRDIIPLQSVKAPHFADDEHKIAYLRLTGFQQNSADELDEAVNRLLDEGMQALVVDLRFNPGGLLPAAVEVTDRFVSDGLIVSTKGRREVARSWNASEDHTYPDFPLALLVSSHSASAAEILAGAVQDHGRGIIVGTRTYGKGSVQSVIDLENGKSAIRLTTAYYYTPSGRLIHRNPNNPDQETWGIDPDVEVKITPKEELTLWQHWRAKHIREIRDRDKSEEPAADTEGSEEEPSATVPEEFGLLAATPGEPEEELEAPEDFRDRTLEAAVEALTEALAERAVPVPAGAAAE